MMVAIGKKSLRHFRLTAWWPDAPTGGVLVFSVAVAFAYSPGLWEVYGIHGDYEILAFYKGSGFFHPEAGHLFSIGRPIAALLSNITLWPLESLSDLRWTRAFAILTMCFLGAQMMSNCISRLRTTPLEALAVTLATFLVPPFIYSIYNPSAWTPHLLTIFLAFAAYTLLGRSNLQAIPFLLLFKRGACRSITCQVQRYLAYRPVLIAALLYQLALFDYPPSALILVVFPVIGILFSRSPPSYRILIAARDIAFIGANLALYAAFTKLVYLPISSLFYKKADASDDPFIMRLIESYQFKLTTDPAEILVRIGRLMTVAGDLWFMPQTQFHVVMGAVLLLALTAANSTKLFERRLDWLDAAETSSMRLRLEEWSGAIVSVLVVGTCFVVSGAAMLTAAGGFVAYRTVVFSIALAAIVFLYGIRVCIEVVAGVTGRTQRSAASVADKAMMCVLGGALAGSFYANYVTSKLAGNEYNYFKGIVQEAIDKKAKTIFFLDSRPLTLPEDNPVIFDEKGRSVPPYELGCLSAYCLQSGAIMHVAASNLGRSATEFTILVPRGDYPVPGLTCPMLTSASPIYPDGATLKVMSTIDYYRRFPSIFCTTYSPAWHDLDWKR